MKKILILIRPGERSIFPREQSETLWNMLIISHI